MLPFLESCKIVRVSNAVAAGTSDSNATSVDVSGFQSVVFLDLLGAIVSGGAQSIKVQGSDDNSTFSDLEDTAYTIADTDDNKIACVEILKPAQRYLRLVTKRATQNTTIDGVVAILSNPFKVPITADSTTLGNEKHVSPGAGTA